MADHSRVLAYIAKCDDAKELKQLIENAKAPGAEDVRAAAFKKLIGIVPSEEPGTLEHDFWQSIQAFELILSEENGKTTRLSRTRQKVAREGVKPVLEGWALGKATEGFEMLMARGMPELAGEAVVLRHPGAFSDAVVAASRARLEVAGVSAAEAGITGTTS